MKVKIRREHSEPIHIGRGVRQGCCFSPIIFKVYLKDVIKEIMNDTEGIRIEGKSIECVRLADDMLLLAENEKTLQEMLQSMKKSFSSYCMKTNKKKMIIGKSLIRINMILKQKIVI